MADPIKPIKPIAPPQQPTHLASADKVRASIQDILRNARWRAISLGGGPAPEPCLAYPIDATEEQKLCMDQACAIYLIRWIGCGNKLDPATCRSLIYQDYLETVKKCLGGEA